MKIQNAFLAILVFLIAYSCSNKENLTGMKTLKDDLKAIFQDPKIYVCYRCNEPIIIDGNATEDNWQKAEWTDLFVDIEGDLKPIPTQNTRVKMLWDDDYLYIFAELEEENIWAYLESHDNIVFRDNDFEFFIDPDNDAKNYFEYEVNAKGTVFDLFLPHPYRHSSFALHNWDFKGLKQAIKIDGTINDGTDKDNKWSIEIALPFSDLSFGLDSGKPNIEKPWRINFSRVQWDTKWENGKYEKIKNDDGKPLPENNWVWSPVGAISMHMPERYGYLKFSKKIVGYQKESFELAQKEKIKNALWAVFYRQAKHFEKHKAYSNSLDTLGTDIRLLYNNDEYKLKLNATDNTFEANIESVDKSVKMRITQEGSVIEF